MTLNVLPRSLCEVSLCDEALPASTSFWKLLPMSALPFFHVQTSPLPCLTSCLKRLDARFQRPLSEQAQQNAAVESQSVCSDSLARCPHLHTRLTEQWPLHQASNRYDGVEVKNMRQPVVVSGPNPSQSSSFQCSGQGGLVHPRCLPPLLGLPQGRQTHGSATCYPVILQGTPPHSREPLGHEPLARQQQRHGLSLGTWRRDEEGALKDKAKKRFASL